MQNKKLLILLLITFALVSCKAQQSGDVEALQPKETTRQNADGAANDAANANDLLSAVPVPESKNVLSEIYKESVQALEDGQLSDGRYVSYWHGHQFMLNGKNYFVGFTEATGASEIEYPAPENQVTLSQATYELVNSKWLLSAINNKVGIFGSYNKPPMVDAEKKVQSFTTPEKLLLAVPTFETATAGVRLSSLEIFVFAEKQKSWKYLGQVETGQDNTAGCANEADSTSPIKCATSTGSLSFIKNDGQDWPGLKVQMQGTDIDDAGKVVTLSNKDFVEYRYEKKSASYKKI
jgi:hypothetical protein